MPTKKTKRSKKAEKKQPELKSIKIPTWAYDAIKGLRKRVVIEGLYAKIPDDVRKKLPDLKGGLTLGTMMGIAAITTEATLTATKR